MLQYVVVASLPCAPAYIGVMSLQHSFHQLQHNTAAMLAVLGSWPSTLEGAVTRLLLMLVAQQ